VFRGEPEPPTGKEKPHPSQHHHRQTGGSNDSLHSLALALAFCPPLGLWRQRATRAEFRPPRPSGLAPPQQNTPARRLLCFRCSIRFTLHSQTAKHPHRATHGQGKANADLSIRSKHCQHCRHSRRETLRLRHEVKQAWEAESPNSSSVSRSTITILQLGLRQQHGPDGSRPSHPW